MKKEKNNNQNISKDKKVNETKVIEKDNLENSSNSNNANEEKENVIDNIENEKNKKNLKDIKSKENKAESTNSNDNVKSKENKAESTNSNDNVKSKKKRKKKRKYTIGGIRIGRLFDYFFLYSIIGFFIETIFGVVVYGVLESRQSFLYGPFCSIYGLGAVIMIPALQRFKKNNTTLFIGGFFVGSAIEYVMSFLGEVLFHMKWWDYSNMPFNLNGRICVSYSIFWGVLAIILMTYINPKIDKIIDKIPLRYFRTVTITGIVILFIDAMVTATGLKMFFARLVTNYDLNLENQAQIAQEIDINYDDRFIKYLDEKVFTDEKIIKTFPNLKLIDKDGNIIWLKDIFKDIKPYYVRLFTPKQNKPLG